jgi:hypothetical protein
VQQKLLARGPAHTTVAALVVAAALLGGCAMLRDEPLAPEPPIAVDPADAGRVIPIDTPDVAPPLPPVTPDASRSETVAPVIPGVCTPGSKRCKASPPAAPEICDDTGAWVPGAPCANACSNGTCVGTCVPGSRRCAGKAVEQCGPLGVWEPQDDCAYVCADGVCRGACVPETRRCLGNTPQTCSPNGQWLNGTACPFLCVGGGVCGGECKPDSRICSGATLRTCRADATYSDSVCPGMGGGTPACKIDKCDYDCNNPALPYKCAGGCCQCMAANQCAKRVDNVATCSAGRCVYSKRCDLEAHSWTQTSNSPCPLSTWNFQKTGEGTFIARETGCGAASGQATYLGATIRVDLVFTGGSAVALWKVDADCNSAGTGSLVFSNGDSFVSTLTKQ